MKATHCLGCGIAYLLLAPPAMAVEIDGHITPDEWAEARHVTDFRQVQPFSGIASSQPTEAWILSTPEGLAVAFRNAQPASVPRTRQKVRRDFTDQVDRVNLYVDFDGDGRTGYNFRVASTDNIADLVITNENVFNSSWDGDWQHAVSEDADGWCVEILVPWHIASMHKVAGEMRTIKVSLDRVIGSTGERVAWPTASFEQPRFLSDFAPVQLKQYSQSLLAVTPYVSGLFDHARGDSAFNGGVDVFWKPRGQLQLSATVNPDFGQVETDDLVVNFSATETFVSDKRPFFTENQGLFEFTTPSDFNQLLYTRRIGAPADDGSGASDIAAAVKLNASLGAQKYGVFVAEEGGQAGRSFHALRAVRDFESQNLGAMWLRTGRPMLDRRSDVLGIDHNWRPNPGWDIRTRVLGSVVDQDGQTTRDSGATLSIDHVDHAWRQQWLFMHFGDNLQLNDAGYLQRGNLNYAHLEVRKRSSELPERSRYASKEWRWRVSHKENDRGDQLRDQVRVVRNSRLRYGSSEFVQVDVNSPGSDDRLTRGHGLLRIPSSFDAHFEYDRPRKGRWAHDVAARLFSGGLASNDKVGYSLSYDPTYFVSDTFNIGLGAYADRTPDWLIWQRNNLIGSFGSREFRLQGGVDWSIGNRQELRVKLQAVAVDARLAQAYTVDSTGHAIPSDEPVHDFSVRSLGFQARYRYELAPLSHLYVVYSRGGYRKESYSDGTIQLLQDSFDLRDDEQFLMKLSYRFEL